MCILHVQESHHVSWEDHKNGQVHSISFVFDAFCYGFSLVSMTFPLPGTAPNASRSDPFALRGCGASGCLGLEARAPGAALGELLGAAEATSGWEMIGLHD